MTFNISKFQQKILDWYDVHKRNLPRRDNENPYWVFVSEVMSQQTQVDRVVPKFYAFISELPDIFALAQVAKPDLLRLWSWLWFNSRAVRLQLAARNIVDNHSWIIPANRKLLLELPWIWPYTSASICAFAYNLPEPVVDTNIRRVLIHEAKLDETIWREELEELARACIPENRSRDWHNALMDYWALVATAKATWIRPLSKQSKFEWSDRQVRGWILKKLVWGEKLHLDDVWVSFPKKEVTSIIRWMVKDHLLRIDESWILFIAST